MNQPNPQPGEIKRSGGQCPPGSVERPRTLAGHHPSLPPLHHPPAWIKASLLVIVLLLTATVGHAAAPASQDKGVAEEQRPGFFALYAENREQQIPNYITEDFLLQAYSMIRQQATVEMEEKTLLPAFTGFVNGLRQQLPKTTEPETLANQEFLAILQALLSGREAPEVAGDAKRATAEMGQVLAAAGIAPSPLWGVEIDYSQFQPRGPYTDSAPRKQYFRAMRYASTILFAVKESKATGVSAELVDRLTAQALQLARLIKADKKLSRQYAALNDTLTKNFGPPDDLILEDVQAASDLKTSKGKGAPTLAERRSFLLGQAKKNGRQPRIISAIVHVNSLEKGVTVEDVLTGWRLLPQRFTIDAAIFQGLIFNRVTTYQGKAKPFGLTLIDGQPVKGFPSALELMALLGSTRAEELLKADDATNFAGYPEAKTKAVKTLAGAKDLAGRQFQVMRTWLSASGQGVPDPERRLTSALAFWTWQRYSSLLYTKQSVTPVGKGLVMENRSGAWLEPATPLYTQLAKLVNEHRTMTPSPLWERFLPLLAKCIEIAKREQPGKPISPDDDSFLNTLDTQLLSLTNGNDHPIVVDVHTEANSGQVVEEGVGLAKVAWQETAAKGKEKKSETTAIKARGALFTHREFKWPLADRLTDEKWQAMLQAEATGVKPQPVQ